MSTRSPEHSPGPAPQPAPLVGEALAWLTGEGRQLGAERLLAGLRERFRNAGREKLADLVYELAKACLAALPELSVRTRLHSEPRAAELVSGEVEQLAASLRAVDDSTDTQSLARGTSAAQAALADARRCLGVLAQLEGASGRQQLACALERIHAGQPVAGEALLRPLLERVGESPAIIRMARVNLAFALLRQARYAEVVPLARAACADEPDNPVPLFNLLAAQAELGVPAEFLATAQELRALLSRQDSALIRNWIAQDLAMLCEVAGLSSQQSARLCAPPVAAEGGP